MEEKEHLDYKELWEKIDKREIVLLDTRIVNEYGKEHIPRSVNVPFTRSGWGDTIADQLGESRRNIAILATNETIAKAALTEAEKHGLNVVAIIADGVGGWKSSNLPIVSIWEISPEELYKNLEKFTIIDIREPFEWRSGVIHGSMKLSMEELRGKLKDFPRDRKYVLVCSVGYRSRTAALFLSENGYDAGNVTGGIARWISKSLPLESD